jgi:hypothetical protein
VLALGGWGLRVPLPATLEYPGALDAAISDGSATAAGDLPALRRLLRAVTSASA